MNLPNILAFCRICIAPIMFFLLVDRNLSMFKNIDPSWIDYFTALLFVIASITDFFDGYIARSWNQITKLGAILDPLADKMLILGALLGLMYIDRASPWAIFIILVREFFVTGLRVIMASENKSVKASIFGKIKTVTQMFAIGFLMMNWPYGSILLWIAVFATIYSGFEYIFLYIKES